MRIESMREKEKKELFDKKIEKVITANDPHNKRRGAQVLRIIQLQ